MISVKELKKYIKPLKKMSLDPRIIMSLYLPDHIKKAVRKKAAELYLKKMRSK